MNSDLSPLLIPKNQLHSAVNLTVRGGFATDRPPVYQRSIVFPSPAIQEAIEQGLFQGSVYYQPDFGPQSLITAISGRLFQFTIVDDTVTATEITGATGGMTPTATKIWMWQSENYVIIQDGLLLPIFFDGTTSRRSNGPTQVLGIANAASGNIPAIGGQVTLTLTAPYTGVFNEPVLFNGFFYQPIENTAGYDVTLTTIYTPIGGVEPIGTEINVEPQNLGYITSPTNLAAGTYSHNVIFFNLAQHYTGGGYASVIDAGGTLDNFPIFPAATPPLRVEVNGTFTARSWPTGTKVQLLGSAPNVLIGKAAAAFTIPTAGNSVNVTLDRPYTGPAGAMVFADGVQYSITAVPPVAPGLSLILINLNDPGTGAFAPTLDVNSVPELPAGRMGAYGMSQNWLSLVDGLSFIASDISRGPSGTPANNFRDSVLKIVDSTFIGGNFAISGAGYTITSMTFTANLDVSLGQGPLQIGTPVSMFSVIAPFDFSNPPADGPIVSESLKGYGPLNQDATINVNSDILFRSTIGFGSFILGRRDFNTATNWGNTTISAEMSAVLSQDDQTLLGYGSAINFDNRFLATVTPQASAQGVIHTGAIALNNDPVSSLRGKQPSVYDGFWTGINVLKYDKGNFGGIERAWAWTYNVALSKIELYEIMPTGDLHFDNGTTRITWQFDTASLFRDDVKKPGEKMRLTYGEIALDDVIGTIRVESYLKADVGGCWTLWSAFNLCVPNGSKPQYFPRLSLGETPATICDSILQTPAREGYSFQIRHQIFGHARFVRGDYEGCTIPQPQWAQPICDTDCEAS